MVWTSEVSPSQVCKDMVNVSLFYSHFSSKKLVCNENYRGVSHAVDRFVDAIDRRFSYSPLPIATVGVSSKFGVLKGKFYQERIWISFRTFCAQTTSVCPHHLQIVKFLQIIKFPHQISSNHQIIPTSTSTLLDFRDEWPGLQRSS